MPTIEEVEAQLAALNQTFAQLSTQLAALTAIVNQIAGARAPSTQFDDPSDSQDIPLI
jgi:hypothetical protein